MVVRRRDTSLHWICVRQSPALSFVLALTAAGAISGLAALWAGQALASLPTSTDVSKADCFAFKVGSPTPATAHVYIANLGRDSIPVIVEVSDDGALFEERWALALAPGVQRDLPIPSPYQAFVRVTSWGGPPLVEAEIVYQAGGSDPRSPISCSPPREA